MKRYAGFKLLVVDDNTYAMSIIKKLLKGYGVQTISDAGDAAEALVEILSTPIDIVLVDHYLEALDGVELSKLVRRAEDSPNPFLPIIMLTTIAERSRVEQARDAGVCEFLRKPLSPADLYLRILEVVERPRPFVRTKTYFGPDRRRRNDPNYKGEERRKANLRGAA